MSYEDNKRRILNKMKGEFYDKLEVIGSEITSAAKRNCTVGQYPDGSGRVGGRARSSISWKTKKDGGGFESHSMGSNDDAVSVPKDELTVKVGSNVEYFKFIELGTKYMKRQAPLRLGLFESRHKIKRILAK